ncbi:MAG: hypothetical protein NT025_10265, partial [bacterium]|nr:hypothetical protein [bacterium]
MRGSMSLRSVLVLSVFSAVIAAGAGSAYAAPVIYEPFADSDPSLTGNTPGTGLTGTWLGSSAVQAGTLTYGSLPTPTGNQVSSNNQNGYVSVGSTLSSAGLLADGATLWFSVLVQTGSDIATNGDLGFGLGTDQIGTGNNIPIANNGQALGFTFKNNQLRASYWTPGTLTRSTTNSGNGAVANTVYLVAGKFTWGASSDTIEIYKVATDLSLGSAVSWYTTPSNVDQSLFDTISCGSKAANPTHLWDEIRFGATYGDVIGAVTAGYWDLNGTTAGACITGNTAAGTWDAANTYWNAAADGTGSTAAWTAGQTACFAAGTDATGTYTVTVDGMQDIGGLTFAKGTVALAPKPITGGEFRLTANATVEVASGLTATVETPISEDVAGRRLTKTGGGTLILSGA